MDTEDRQLSEFIAHDTVIDLIRFGMPRKTVVRILERTIELIMDGPTKNPLLYRVILDLSRHGLSQSEAIVLLEQSIEQVKNSPRLFEHKEGFDD